MSGFCPVPGCGCPIPAQRIVCLAHWDALPKELRYPLNRLFTGRFGRDRARGRPLGPDAQAAIDEAVRWLVARERRR